MKRKREWTIRRGLALLLSCLLLAGCSQGAPDAGTQAGAGTQADASMQAEAGDEAESQAAQTAATESQAVRTTVAGEAETAADAVQEPGLTLGQLSKEHGFLVSTTEEPITEEQLTAIYETVESVTLGNETTWQLTTIHGLDLLQELLPTYAQAGLLHEGNVAIIVSCSSDTGTAEQYHVTDNTRIVAAGMVAQQICVAAQMQGIGFKVITDCIPESSYTLYVDNIADEEHLLKEAMGWEEWVTQFAVPRENYYVMDDSRTPVKTISGEPIALENGGYTYYEADGEMVAGKVRTEYVKGYMTPCVVVLLGNSEEEPVCNIKTYDKFVTEYDGRGNPYPEEYGGSGQGS